MDEGKLFLIAGPSGSGKKTLINKILKDKDINLILSTSFTTRKPRIGEINGVDYLFVSKDEFRKKIEDGEMLEYAEFFNNYYGTCKKWVESMLKEGKNILLEIETEGFMQIQKKFPDLVSIFILPVSMKELEKRLKERGTENDDEIAMRLAKARTEISKSSLFNYQIVNDDLETSANELINIVKKEIQIKKSR